MSRTNAEKKEEIEKIVSRYAVQMADIERRREAAIQAFLEKARLRRIEEIKAGLKTYGTVS